MDLRLKRSASCILSWMIAGLSACAATGESPPNATSPTATSPTAELPSLASASRAPTPGTSSPSDASSAEPATVSAPANDPKHHDVLRAIARSYSSFYRADGTWWAPLDCRAPPDDVSHLSRAPSSSDGHGRKLYTLQIADYASYAKATGAPLRAGGREGIVARIPGAEQIVVKVSYEPILDAGGRHAFGIAPATHEGKTYYPGPQRELFVMYRPSAKDIESDAGWLYGTVSPDGGKVSSAGKVESCMGCHAKAPHGRLFGLQ